ncbi:hypothetical protein BY458DRAFT_521947 [Sporodiniella umbellata]|nr:hypothetical protein BY458DRAFT_521947 [Sporodiniella umbellata]
MLWNDESLKSRGEQWIKRNRRKITSGVKWAAGVGVVVLFSFLILCRMEVNAHVFLRGWLSPQTPPAVEPLSAHCFKNKAHPSQQRYTVNFVPGLPVWEAETCYDFAKLFRGDPLLARQRFHTYWSSNLTLNFDQKPMATLRSFVATQSTNHTLTLWIPAEDEPRLLSSDGWRSMASQRVAYQLIDRNRLVQHTAIAPYVDAWRQVVAEENSENRDDLLRLLVLYQYGGTWFDLDTLFVRDLSPLFEHEWIAQGNCHTGMFGNPFTGALFRFHQHSPYACEILEGAADLLRARDSLAQGLPAVPKRYLIQGPEIFGSKLYYRIYRRLLHHHIKPWSILPWCFTDPSQCRTSNSLPSMFAHTHFKTDQVQKIFAYHWRDRWSASPGSIYQHLDALHREKTLW